MDRSTNQKNKQFVRSQDETKAVRKIAVTAPGASLPHSAKSRKPRTQNIQYLRAEVRSPVIIASECPAVESDCGLPIPCPTMLFVLTFVLAMMFSLPLCAASAADAPAIPAPDVVTVPAHPAQIDHNTNHDAAPIASPAKPAQSDKPGEKSSGELFSSPLEQQSIRHSGASSANTGAKTSDKKETASNGSSTTNTIIQVTCALVIVVGLIYVGRNLARKYIPGAAVGNGKGVVEVLARHALNRQQSIVLVRIGSQIVALNQTRESSQSVLVISDPQEVASILGQVQGEKSTSIQKQFNSYLKTARHELEDGDDPDLLEASKAIESHNLEEQLDEMAAARRQLMELRNQVRSVRDNLNT